jgi:hypothetical protein
MSCWRRLRPRLGIAGGIGAVALVIGAAYAQMPGPPPTAGWLKALSPDKQIDAISRQLRGFDMAMVEVGYRYTELYFGATEGNWDYALYTGEKLAWAMQNGFERRPRRKANGEEIFFMGAYPEVLAAIRKKDLKLFKSRFDEMTSQCNACHSAEKVPFMVVGAPVQRLTPLVHK